MTGPQKTSLVGLVALALGIALTDVWLLVDGEHGNTFSSVIQSMPWTAGVIGYMAAHLARRPDQTSPIEQSWYLTGGFAILAGVASSALDGGFFGLAIGAGLGYFGWGNNGRT